MMQWSNWDRGNALLRHAYRELWNKMTLRAAFAVQRSKRVKSALRGSPFGSPRGILGKTLRNKTPRPGKTCAPRDSNPKPAESVFGVRRGSQAHGQGPR